MRAAVLYGHGELDQLVVEDDFADPVVGAGQVIIAVHASSLNYHDLFTVRGMPGIKVPMPAIPGLDIAGEIIEIGPGVSGWSIGDRVLVDPLDKTRGLMGELLHGGLAERCLVGEEQLIRIPEGVGYAQAAALPVAYGTAHRMLFTNGSLGAGQRVLILGASGGVGTCCVMLAKMVGAEVIACASSAEKLERLRQLGADRTIDYTKERFVKQIHAWYGKPARRAYEGGVDMVINYTGGDTWTDSMRCLKRGGQLITCGATAGFDPKTDLRYIWSFELKILGSNSWAREDLEELLRLVAEGKIDPAIDRVLPLRDVHEGLRLLADRRVFGKVIIAPDRR
ncbi:MAG: zinc-binding dehydrogenase [bacterium]|nr:zinc-binding dehydrogenase [bacterium]